MSRTFAADSPNSAIRLAVIGLGGKRKSHVKNVLATTGAQLTALCDVDPERLAAQVQVAKEAGLAPFTATDPRKILERDDVDAVIIATPNHWHATLAIWACRAGKDVYVEKPMSHDIWEGAQLATIARQTSRIVQAGTQYRSDEGLRAAAAWIKEGHIGKATSAHIVWYEYRPSIGRAEPYRPTNLDYDLYCGPAPADPLTRPKLHYDWHWVWSTGDGDLGNSGVHPIDACRMLAGLTGLPRRALGLGGRFGVDDAGQTPNTQLTLLDYPGLPMLVENRNLPAKSSQKAMDQFRGIREGVTLDCEGGSFVGLKGGGWIYDREGKRVRQFPGGGGGRHLANFLAAIRTRQTEDLNGPILQGHYSSALCHVCNLSWRLGRSAALQACRDAARNHPGAADAAEQLVRHLAANEIEVVKTRFTLGPWLELDPVSAGITAVSGNDSDLLARARQPTRGIHRASYGFHPAG